MSDKQQQPSGLEAIWGGVQAEIESARRRRRYGRFIARTGAALGVLAVLTGAFLLSSKPRGGQETAWGFSPWQVRDISGATGISADYPLARGKQIFVVQGSEGRQHVACIGKRSGQLEWANPLEFSHCRLAADDARVYLLAHTEGGRWVCAALNARSGETVWQQAANQTAGGSPSTLAVLRGAVCWSEGDQVTLRDGATGNLIWRKALGGGRLLSAPVEQGEAVYVASTDEFHALSRQTGELLWSEKLGERSGLAGFIRPLLEADGGRVYCASRNRQGNGTLCCLETDTRKVRWTRETEAPIKLHVSGGQVFVRAQDLKTFDARTGQALWEVAVGGCGTLSFSAKRVYLVDKAEKGRVVALDRATGKRVWNHAAAPSCNGIVVSGRMGILSGNDRTLYVFAINEQSS